MKRGTIDWEQARKRLRVSESGLEQSLVASPQRVEAAYRLRAARLANEKASPKRKRGESEHKPVSSGLPVLVFWLAQERYAIELKELAEVIPFAGCTPVPGAPAQFLGVINLRGELRAVLDLGRLLAPAEPGNSDSGCVLVLRSVSHGIGLKVERIGELREIRPEELTLPARGNYLQGITSETLMLLDIEAVVAKAFSKEES